MNYNEEENDKNDYFEGTYEPEPPKGPKPPALSPDDPRYWDQEESEFEHLRPRRRWVLWAWLVGAGLLAGTAVGIYLRWFSPYIEEATAYGYVENIERRGTIFKTYEGVILPYKNLMDTTRLYKEDFVFTADPSVAADLRRMQYANRPVRVGYRRYHATLPWRGESTIYVERVDTVDPADILPPEFSPSLR